MKKSIKIAIIALLLGSIVACSKDDTEDKKIVVGASTTPHALILEAARPAIESQGYTLEIVEFTDYVLPNTALDVGDLDANYFQHVPYLNKFNAERNTKLASVLAIHFEPLGLYPGRSTSVSAITAGGVTIAIPNDPTNETRALRLLEDNGYISFGDDGTKDVTPINITENPYNITFVEMEAALLPQTLVDVDFAVINGNYALGANIQGSVLLTEDKDSHAANTFANVLVVQIGKENSEKTQVLISALSSTAIKQYIENTFYPTVISVLP